MHTTLQRNSLYSHLRRYEQQQQQQQQGDQTGRLGSSRSGVDLRAMAAHESDDIDDILCNLWPTSGAEPCAANGSSFLAMAYPSHQAAGLQQTGGQNTPPEDTCGRAMAATLTPLHLPYSQLAMPQGAGGTPGSYSVVATPSPTHKRHPFQQQQLQDHHAMLRASQVGTCGSTTRSISAYIQIGDPEWRVDSPQSMRTSSPPQLPQVSASTSAPRSLVISHGKSLTKVPSPVSPTTMASDLWHSPAIQDSGPPHHDVCLTIRPQPTTLGLGHARGPPTNRSATLGLQTRNASLGHKASATRMLTAEERVARLNTVSGLAARAVARRCLSGQILPMDADQMLRQASANSALMPAQAQASMPALAPPPKKLTFADVARGLHD
ncbi:hypothetical protein LPJ64_000213 [Coemansia asiatica]|uniref:Uncharacterized protein n=1 Tax=Coemansia asiatica TaxID=1052880 RepID=A0A9W7XRY4_9FUNG|nr:hypothetical protein LPJ64_000213 [Coemansia asiatica]